MEKIYNNKVLKRIVPTCILILMTLICFFLLFIIKNNEKTIFEQAINFSQIDIAPIVFSISLVLEIIIFVIGMFVILIKNKKYNPFYILGLIFTIILLCSGISLGLLAVGHVALLVFNLILSILGIVYYYVGKLKYNSFESLEENICEYTEKQHINKLRAINVFNIIELFLILMLFFIPIAQFEYESNIYSCYLIRGIFGSKDLYEIIPCIALIIFYVFAINQYFNVFRLFKCRSKKFLESSKKLLYYIFGIVIVFFIIGVVGANVISTALSIEKVNTYSVIPFFIFIPIVIIHGLLIGSVGYEVENKKLNNSSYKWAIFFFVTLFTLVTFVSLFLPIISISYSDNQMNVLAPDYTLTPWDLLVNSNQDAKLNLLSFVVLAVVLISSILYILAVIAIFAKSKEAKRIGLTSIFANYFFIVVMGLFGRYYKISYYMIKDQILSYFSSKYPIINFVAFEDPIISSQIFILIFVDTIIAILLLLFKPFTNSDNELLGSIKLDTNDEPIRVNADIDLDSEEIKEEETLEEPKEEIIEEDTLAPEEEIEPIEDIEPIESIKEEAKKLYSFDACPSFTELDLENEHFIEEYNIRRTKLFENPSLPALVTFVVDYARESRLHLSYTPEAIASFIAGLGATRLAILQGMSGTGKTSLPKIFLEALLGNCEIIEVESSWKDKNELLGYYNEFSKIYTPKKFTRALYKASLNPSIITFIVLDEMNLSRIEYYFSDFLSLMENEPDNRKIQLTNIKIHRTEDSIDYSYLKLENDHTLLVPSNVWFIGTANRDESTFEISDKVYDRAFTMNFNKRAPKVRNYSQPIEQRFLEYQTFEGMLEEVINTYDFDLESVPYIKEVEEILRPFNISFGNRIMNQIEKYVKIYSACFNYSPEAINDAIEDILLSKVVAKLEFKAIEDKEELIRKFEKLDLYKCSEFIKRLSEDF